MTELILGSAVSLFPADICQAERKVRLADQSLCGARLAQSLMATFWSSKELVGSTVSQAPVADKLVLDQQVVNAITREKFR